MRHEERDCDAWACGEGSGGREISYGTKIELLNSESSSSPEATGFQKEGAMDFKNSKAEPTNPAELIIENSFGAAKKG